MLKMTANIKLFYLQNQTLDLFIGEFFMSLHILYNNISSKGTLQASSGLPSFAWNRIVDAVLSIQPDCELYQSSLVADWTTILSLAPQLATLRQRYGFIVTYDPQAEGFIRQHGRDYSLARQARDSLKATISQEQIRTRLQEIGFTRRVLTDEQIRDTVHLVSLAHGANFSVPGAGKTTVAFATHLLTRDADTFLLVIAPKNAFSAWDEVIVDTLDDSHPYADCTKFVRLTSVNVGLVLNRPPLRMIISYDQLLRSIDILRLFLHGHKTHLILDESHRMKAGDRSIRGSMLLSIAHLPIRRDILSGTPIPRSIEDIAPQVDFLWPGQGLGRRIVSSASPRDDLRGLFVRTTKRELDLPRRRIEHIAVPMTQAQLLFYSILRDEALKHLAHIRADGRLDWQAARRSIMRLLQASSNPDLAVRAMTQSHPQDFPYDDIRVKNIFQSIAASPISPKMLEASRLARTLAERGEKVVIWTSFTHNVEQIAEQLQDLKATFIHGKVDTGSDDDDATREGRIRRFHEDPECFALVANPAACSEGISLHRACHSAIYVDRTYNGAHFLQSIDRIHRLGLPKGVETNVYVLESVAPQRVGAIDYSVRRRLIQKLHIMAEALEDSDLRQLALDEEEGDQPVDYDLELEDLHDLLEEFEGEAIQPLEDEPI